MRGWNRPLPGVCGGGLGNLAVEMHGCPFSRCSDVRVRWQVSERGGVSETEQISGRLLTPGIWEMWPHSSLGFQVKIHHIVFILTNNFIQQRIHHFVPLPSVIFRATSYFHLSKTFYLFQQETVPGVSAVFQGVQISSINRIL